MEVKRKPPWLHTVIHIIVPAGLTIFLFVGSYFLFVLPKFEKTFQQHKKELIKEEVNTVLNLIQDYYQRVEEGHLTEKEAKLRVINRLRQIRYGPENKDYFWINDLEPRVLMHPYRTDLEGKNVADYTDPEGKHTFVEFVRIVEEHEAGYIDYMWQWKDNSQRIVPKLSYIRLFKPWGWIVGTGIYLDDVELEMNSITRRFYGHFIGICIIISLISGYLIMHGIREERRRHKAEQEIIYAFERFKTVMDSLQSVVYVCDIEDHTLLFLNKFGKQLAGDVIGQPCWKVLQQGQNGPCDFCTNEKLLDENGNPTGVHTWEFQNPVNKKWFECHDQAIRWVDGKIARLEIANEITERKETEEERDYLVNNLSMKNEELQSIVYVASHDLRSPLINIQGFSGELERTNQHIAEIIEQYPASGSKTELLNLIKEEIPNSLNFIKTNTDKMEFLVNGLLQLSRIGTATIHIKTLDMNKLIDDVITACQYQIRTYNATVSVEPLPDAKGDYSQINQVFSNLIDNALKYRHPYRPLEIKITAKPLDGRIEYAVEDNGIGIESSHLKHIFEMFHQLNPSEPNNGVGLGLTIVKRILDIQNGSIRVESVAGKKSIFYIILPRA